MKIKKFLGILKKEKVWNTVAPTLNLWGIYVIVVVLVEEIMGVTVVTISSVLVVILWSMQKEKVREACKQFWKEIPTLFHTIFIMLEIGVFLWLLDCLSKILAFMNKIVIFLKEYIKSKIVITNEPTTI